MDLAPNTCTAVSLVRHQKQDLGLPSARTFSSMSSEISITRLLEECEIRSKVLTETLPASLWAAVSAVSGNKKALIHNL